MCPENVFPAAGGRDGALSGLHFSNSKTLTLNVSFPVLNCKNSVTAKVSVACHPWLVTAAELRVDNS